MDKTNFRIVCEKTQLVVIMDINKSFRMTYSENYNCFTSIQCISSSGESILLILLIFRVNILQRSCLHNDLGQNIMIDKTETGYAYNKAKLEWIHYLIDQIQNKKRSE